MEIIYKYLRAPLPWIAIYKKYSQVSRQLRFAQWMMPPTVPWHIDLSYCRQSIIYPARHTFTLLHGTKAIPSKIELEVFFPTYIQAPLRFDFHKVLLECNSLQTCEFMWHATTAQTFFEGFIDISLPPFCGTVRDTLVPANFLCRHPRSLRTLRKFIDSVFLP